MYTTGDGSIFVLSNLSLKQGVGYVYVIVDFICTGSLKAIIAVTLVVTDFMTKLLIIKTAMIDKQE